MKTIDIVSPLVGFASILGIAKLCYTLNLEAYYAARDILTDIFFPPFRILYCYKNDLEEAINTLKADDANEDDGSNDANEADEEITVRTGKMGSIIEYLSS